MGYVWDTVEHGWRSPLWKDRINLAVYVRSNIPYIWVRMKQIKGKQRGGNDRGVEEKSEMRAVKNFKPTLIKRKKQVSL